MSALAMEFADRARSLFAAEPDAEEWRVRKVTMLAKDEFAARGIYVPRNLITPIERQLMNDAVGMRWQRVPGGAVATEGNLIHLKIGDDVAEDLEAEEPQGDAAPFAEEAARFAHLATDAGHVELGQAARRAAIGVDRPAGAAAASDVGRRLATMDFDPNAEFVPPSWLAKGLLPRKGIGLLFGESGAGKSFAAIHAALCVVWGQPLFEKKVKQGGVLYVAAEGGSSVAGRFRAANDAMGAAVAAARLSGERPQRAPVRIVTEAPDLSRDGDPKALLRTIADAAHDFEEAGFPLALVVVDTWHAAMGGGDENSAADAGAALKPLRDAAESGAFHCLIVHHPGKDSERGARGSNALPAAADAIIAVTVPGFDGAKAKPSDALRRATITKMRDGEAGGEFCYRLPVVEMGIDEDGDPITTCRVEPCHAPKLDDDGLTKHDRAFMDALRAGQGERIRLDEVRARFYAAMADAAPGSKRKAFGRARDAAIRDGRIEVDEAELWAWPK